MIAALFELWILCAGASMIQRMMRDYRKAQYIHKQNEEAAYLSWSVNMYLVLETIDARNYYPN